MQTLQSAGKVANVSKGEDMKTLPSSGKQGTNE